MILFPLLYRLPILNTVERLITCTSKVLLICILFLEQTASPDMVTEPSDTELNSGDTEDFQCRADGRPLPTIIWKKNGVILSNTTNIYITEEAMGDYMLISTLTLVNATLDDIGVYECTASNDIGDISGVFNLTVFGMYLLIRLMVA